MKLPYETKASEGTRKDAIRNALAKKKESKGFFKGKKFGRKQDDLKDKDKDQ